MKFYLKIIAIIVASFTLITNSLALDFFPTNPGPVYHYSYGAVIVNAHPGGVITRTLCADCYMTTVTTYTVDDDGDVFLENEILSCPACFHPSGRAFYPRLKYLDFPLEEGKTWSTTALESRFYDAPSDSMKMIATVLGPKTVQVEAGEFEVTAVLMVYLYFGEPGNSYAEEKWFHYQLGPVDNLVSWSGVVEVSETSWGSLKAIFR